MAITNFQPEIWAAQLLSVLSKSLVYGGSPVVNRDYEGDISQYGDTVHIVSIADPTISTYTKDTDLTVQVLTDADRTLTIDQAKAFAFEIDDIDMRQVRNSGGLMSEAANRAGFGLADVADQYLAGKMAAGAGNTLGVVDATTVTNVYDNLVVPSAVKLDENNVPSQGRFLVVSPSVYGKLLLDSRFIKANESGTAALHNGLVGEAAGFMILKSNNAFQGNRSVTATTASGGPGLTALAGVFNQGDVGLTVTGTGINGTPPVKIISVSADGTTATLDKNSTASASVTITLAGGGQLAIAGSAIATSYAEQISKVEAFRPEKRFADALKGLHLYGAKVVRPEALVVSSVKTS